MSVSKKYRGHYCRICGRTRANERFSGKGHRDHICKDCQRLPIEERTKIDLLNEIHHYLEQSNISEANIQRLKKLCFFEEQEIADLAILILNVALVKPHKKRRLKVLRQNAPFLLKKLIEADLVYELPPLDEYDDLEEFLIPGEKTTDDLFDNETSGDFDDSDIPF